MASEMPPTTAAQPKSLSAQQDKRLLVRLTAWGGVAALSLVAAAVVSQTGTGSRRLEAALLGTTYIPDIPVATAVPLPPAELVAVARATEAVRRATDTVKRTADRTAAKLEAVEQNTAAMRTETKRLAQQVNKLSADSFRVTGRLASIENQIHGITGSIKDMTGSIKQQAEEAAAAAVAKAVPPKPAFDNTFDVTAPIISPPATTFPNLSLIMPPTPGDKSTSKPATGPDVAFTSAITTPKANDQIKDQTKVDSKSEAKAEVDARLKMMPTAKGQIAMKSEADTGAKPDTMSKPMPKPKAAQSAPPAKMLHVTVRPGPYARSLLPQRGYGVDLGGADSITVVNAQWAAVKANFGPMLAGMRPTPVRDHRILSGGSYRLVIGRVQSMKAAKRLCSRFAREQVSCQPVEFDDGQVIWR